MTRNAIALLAALALAGAAYAETKPTDKPGDKPAATKPAPKAEKKTPAKLNRVTYACDGGVNLVVTYPPEGQKTRPVKIAVKDTIYFVRPAKSGGADSYENPKIRLVFQTKGDEATLEREGKPLAEKCKSSKPGT